MTNHSRHKQTSALYVAGGGVHSAKTAGMLAAIDCHGLTDSFDYYIGQSAGSFSLMFLLSGMAVEGSQGYWTYLAQSIKEGKIVSWKHLFKRGRIMDIDYFVDEMISIEGPIMPWQKVLEHPANKAGCLVVQVFDAASGSVCYLSHFSTINSLKKAIKASSWIPLIAGRWGVEYGSQDLQEVQVRDHKWQTIEPSRLYCYDALVGDLCFAEARAVVPVEQHWILSKNHMPQNTVGRASLFPAWLRWFEWWLCGVLFSHVPEGVKAYRKNIVQNEMMNRYQHLVDESRTPESAVILIGPNRMVEENDCSSRTFREGVYAGWDGLCESLHLPKEPKPPIWLVDECV